MSRLSYEKKAKYSIANSYRHALGMGTRFVGTEHLLLGMLEAMPEFFPGDAAVADLESRVRSLAARSEGDRQKIEPETMRHTPRLKSVLDHAQYEAKRDGAAFLEPVHLLHALLVETEGIGSQVLHESGIDWEQVARNAKGKQQPEAGLELIKVTDESEAPYYEQIVSQIKEAVAAGNLNAGDKLPSVRMLADSLQLAPGTVARAYTLLEEEGVVETAGAKGTLVAQPKSTPSKSGDRIGDLSVLLRPVVVEAFHMGGSIEDIFEALRIAVVGVFNGEVSDFEFPEDMDFTFEG